MRTIVIRLKKAGKRTDVFSISDGMGNILIDEVSKQELIQGVSLSIADNVSALVVSSTGLNCCSLSITIPITTITKQELADWEFQSVNTSSVWRHLTDPTLYNNFYGCIHPYVLEYPFAYQYYDEIVQNVKDYTKVYKYLPSIHGVFDDTRRIETDVDYFNKSILYNDQQSSGILTLVSKPVNNMKEYMKYPIFNTDNKSITFTKSDNFYQYNTFWNIVKNKTTPLFVSSCQSMSIDKEVNDENMDYSTRSFRKDTIRAKDLKVRQILDNRSDIHLVSQFIIAPAQISYK